MPTTAMVEIQKYSHKEETWETLDESQTREYDNSSMHNIVTNPSDVGGAFSAAVSLVPSPSGGPSRQPARGALPRKARLAQAKDRVVQGNLVDQKLPYVVGTYQY